MTIPEKNKKNFFFTIFVQGYKSLVVLLYLFCITKTLKCDIYHHCLLWYKTIFRYTKILIHVFKLLDTVRVTHNNSSAASRKKWLSIVFIFWKSVAYKQKRAKAECCYLVTSHEAQVPEGFAALSNLCGSLVCNVFTPAGVHGLYGAAILANGYQSCKQRRERKREVGNEGETENR